MRKSITILLIIVLMLQICTGFLVNSNESDRTNMKMCEVEDEGEYGGRASRVEEWDNHTDARGPERSATSSASVPAEQDEFGGSWFDDFDDNSGIESGLGGRMETDEHTVGLWHFDNGTGNKAWDASGNGNHGNLTNMEEEDWVNGMQGRGLEFDGQDDYIFRDAQEWGFSNNYSLSAWVKSSQGGYIIEFKHSPSGSNNNGIFLVMSNQGIDFYSRNSNGGICHDFSSQSKINNGRWHYITVTQNTTTAKIYVDGEFEVSSGAISSRTETDTRLYIGINRKDDDTGFNSPFKGMIDEVRISNITRTPEEIRRNYEGGMALRNGKVVFAENKICAGVNWTKVTTSAQWSARRLHQSLVFDDKMWVIGGSTGGGYINDVWNSTDGVTWSQATANAGWGERFGHQSLVFDNKMWVIGGCEGSGTEKHDVWYSSDGVTWSEATSNPGWTERFNHQSLVFDNQMWVIGGEDTSVSKNDIWYSSDGVTWSEATSNPGWAGRGMHQALVFNDKMWVIGGASGCVNDVWSSSDGITWSQATANAGWSGRKYHQSLVFDSKMWVIGGENGGGIENDVWYSSDGVTWSEATSNPGWNTRSQHRSIVFNDKIWLIGGEDNNGRKNDVWYSFIPYYTNATITTTSIILPDNMTWDTLSIAKTEPTNTHINVSVINNATNQTIPGFDNCTNRTIDLSKLNDLNITSIRLKANFSGNGSATASLDSWGVEWTAENAWRDSFVGDGKCIYPVDVDEHTVGYWKFEEGSGNVTRDISGNGNDGKLINMEEENWVEGRYGKALEFDGVDDSVEILNSDSLDIEHEITIETWINIKSFIFPQYSWCDIIIKAPGGSVDFWNYGLILQNDGKFAFGNGDGVSHFLSYQGELKINKWEHIGVTMENSVIIYYLNGREIWRGNNNVALTENDSPIEIGRQDEKVEFNGTIDEVRISNIARTPEEIHQAYQAGIAIHGGQVGLADNEIVAGQNTSALWHFNEGEGNVLHDSSGNGNDGVIHGANWTDGVMGEALEFDGVDDYVDINSMNGINNDEGSITFWVKRDWITGQKNTLFVFGDLNSNDLNDIGVRFDDNISVWIFGSWVPYCRLYAQYPINWKDGEWHHISITWKNSSTARILLDGIISDEKSITMAPDIIHGSIGCSYRQSPYNYLASNIDEVAIYNRALAPSEIQTQANHYHHNSTLHSETITLQSNQIWDTLHCNRTVPDNTYLNISVHDATTNETLLEDQNRTDDLSIDLSGIDSLDHPSIYLQAYFQSNRTETPVLYDWAVNWTNAEVVLLPPDMSEDIGNISFLEDTIAPIILNLSNHFQDANDPVSPLSYSILNTGGQHINATVNGTLVSFWSDAANWSGAETFKVVCTNGLNLSVDSNVFNVTVIPVDDRPMWRHRIQDIVLTEDNSSEPINLTELVEDAENDTFDFSWNVDEINITVNVSQGDMRITPADNWFGNGTVELTAYQVSNDSLNSTITFGVEVTSENDPPTTNLRSPVNGSTFNTREITLSWSGFDVESSTNAIRYDIYISNDLTRGITGNDATHTNIEGTNLTMTLDYGTYYWTVIGFDGEGYGICGDGYYTFNITNITIPTVELLSPAPNSTVNTTIITLEWKAIDSVGISYILYFGNSSDSLLKIAELGDTSYLMSDLEENNTYYWKVCAKMNNITGECASGVWQFTIDTSFEYIYEISVDVDTDLLLVQQGQDGIFTMSITNLGNAVVTIQFTPQGDLKDLLVLADNTSLVIDGQEDIVVTLTGTLTLVPSTYNAQIVLSYHGKTKTITVPIKIVGKSDPGTDADEDEGMSGLTKALVIGGIILILIVIIVLFLVFRKKKKEDEEEEDKEPAEQPIGWQTAPQQPLAHVPYQQPVAETAPPIEEAVDPIPPMAEEPEAEYESIPTEEMAPPADVTPPLNDIFGVPETSSEETTPPELTAPAPPPVEEKTTSYKDFIAETPPEPISSNVMRLIPNNNITQKLGAGGFGTVYKATHISGRSVAIKLPKMLGETIDMNVLTKFQEEAEIWRKLNHPNIVEFIEGEIRPVPYLAIELMEGGNLKQLVSKYQLNIGEAVFIMAQILDGMSFAHRMATIHRDLKPENILFTKDGVPKISDWGIGKFMGSMSADKTIGMKGTMLYSAPEQISKAKFGQVDWTTDIFQLGIVFYEMITRQHPFYDEDPVGIIGKITGEDPVPPSEINPQIPKELDNIIMTALQKDKANRWRSADIMHHELKRLVEG